MKVTILSMAMSILLFAACNNGAKTPDNANNQNDSTLTPNKGDVGAKSTASTGDVLDSYLALKNALTRDDDKSAAQAGNQLVRAIESIDKSSLPATQSKVFADVADDAKEHAEHIGTNAGNIKHQREHFETLSQEIYDLVKAGGSAGRKLYYDNCPMYNDRKGGNWISETKEIQNPYLGKGMPTCGSVKEELN
ncbi:DUF3347 domain-containing protein [Arcticibacter tournemirensis]|uniref:DUF3347 domain-containing protein n=1 Tax=Arcticibacter tournemirensis TaxID=699437 RepID=A0A5M9GGY9_9SPHI|nr:DUF3347 domain-containing protein [Arcticibacter tournemirensis]KAA8473882.1 DUF3347 domain-containing protein [Arcticibacter tournemirensis]